MEAAVAATARSRPSFEAAPRGAAPQDEAVCCSKLSLILRCPSLASRACGEALLRLKLGLWAERPGLEGWTRAVLVILALVAAAPASATAEPGGAVVNFGRYDTQLAGKPEKAERTASGIVQPVDGHRLLERTDVIVGQLGNTFGIEVKLENFPGGVAALVIRTLHPPLTNPATGKVTSVSEYDWTSATGDSAYFCFSFDAAWEIAEGAWTMQVLHEGKVIAEKTFKVIVPLN